MQLAQVHPNEGAEDLSDLVAAYFDYESMFCWCCKQQRMSRNRIIGAPKFMILQIKRSSDVGQKTRNVIRLPEVNPPFYAKGGQLFPR